MWERIKEFLNSLQRQEDVDTIAEEVLYFLQDEDISEEIIYEIEMQMYGVMDGGPTVPVFLKKLGTIVRSHLEKNEWNLLEKGSNYFSDDEEVEDMYDGYSFKDIG